MSIMETNEEEDTRVVSLRLIPGGKGPPSPPRIGYDWLSALPARTIFAARNPKVDASMCIRWQVDFIWSETVRGLSKAEPGMDDEMRIYVISAFCNEWELMDIIVNGDDLSG